MGSWGTKYSEMKLEVRGLYSLISFNSVSNIRKKRGGSKRKS